MTNRIDDLLARMRELQEELELELARRRREFEFAIEKHRIRFPLEALERLRRQRISLWRYVRGARPAVVLTAPLIFAGILPFALMDLFVSLFQGVCFPIYGIPRVRRADFLLFDRGDLPYLNLIEKLNCAYCSYANGVAAYTREVAARTEQYWCPIKHARRAHAAHERYPAFFEFGDAEAYRLGLARLRRQYDEAATPPAEPDPPPAPPR